MSGNNNSNSNTNNNVVATTTPSAPKRGLNFSNAEDLVALAAKAFVRASEDPVAGANQKNATFKQKLHDECVRMVRGYNSRTGMKLVNRTANSVFNRFKKMSKLCLKLIGVETAVGDPPSGDNDKEEWLDRCKKAFLERNPDCVNICDSIDTCKCFLEGFPKWRTYQEGEDKAAEAQTGKRPRPPGNKRAKEKEADKKFVMSVLSGSTDGSEDENSSKKLHVEKMNGFMDTMSGSCNTFAQAFGLQMKKSNEIQAQANHVQLLSHLSPSKREALANALYEKQMRELKEDADENEEAVLTAEAETVQTPITLEIVGVAE